MVPDRQKVWTDGWPDGMDGRTDDAKTIFLRLRRGITINIQDGGTHTVQPDWFSSDDPFSTGGSGQGRFNRM